jgi:hypothetical protein
MYNSSFIKLNNKIVLPSGKSPTTYNTSIILNNTQADEPLVGNPCGIVVPQRVKKIYENSK